jgi:hypothetical protein
MLMRSAFRAINKEPLDRTSVQQIQIEKGVS